MEDFDDEELDLDDGGDEDEEVIFTNHYYCPGCNNYWTDDWSCMCNDRCGGCDCEYEPFMSDEPDGNIVSHVGNLTAFIEQRRVPLDPLALGDLKAGRLHDLIDRDIVGGIAPLTAVEREEMAALIVWRDGLKKEFYQEVAGSAAN